MTLLELAALSLTATIVISAMLGVACAMYRRRIPASDWDLEPTRTSPEQRYRGVQE